MHASVSQLPQHSARAARQPTRHGARRDCIARDPSAAIASSKELVESVCKVVLDDYGVSYGRKDDLLDLYKAAAKALKLNAEAVPDDTKGSEAAQRALRAMATTVQNLAELRNQMLPGRLGRPY